ncbi:MAG: hypothetical protein DRN15_06770 [Thermoprotei archaeon]|nr:MAG: hypothetical protein DRN15_06770 [Thermoprotei archaeon]RLF25823.1 MAG: hypothetical protein DRM97_00450 [Thermoprotei archaeon]
MERSSNELLRVFERLSAELPHQDVVKLRRLKDKLELLHAKRLVKINHSVMELVVAAHLIAEGYDVDVEHRLNELLICDVYATNEDSTLIVEVETGFVPPENAEDPIVYRSMRELAKVARYSMYADLFLIAVPLHHVLMIPPFLLLPADKRVKLIDHVKKIHSMLSRYYSKPPISLDELLKCRLDGVMLVDVDELRVYKMSLIDYYSLRIAELLSLNTMIFPKELLEVNEKAFEL